MIRSSGREIITCNSRYSPIRKDDSQIYSPALHLSFICNPPSPKKYLSPPATATRTLASIASYIPATTPCPPAATASIPTTSDASPPRPSIKHQSAYTPLPSTTSASALFTQEARLVH